MEISRKHIEMLEQATGYYIQILKHTREPEEQHDTKGRSLEEYEQLWDMLRDLLLRQ